MQLHFVAISQECRQGERADEAGVGEPESAQSRGGPLDGSVTFVRTDRRGEAAQPTHPGQDLRQRLAPAELLRRHDEAAGMEDQEQISERGHGISMYRPLSAEASGRSQESRIRCHCSPSRLHRRFGVSSDFSTGALTKIDEFGVFVVASSSFRPVPGTLPGFIASVKSFKINGYEVFLEPVLISVDLPSVVRGLALRLLFSRDVKEAIPTPSGLVGSEQLWRPSMCSQS